MSGGDTSSRALAKEEFSSSLQQQVGGGGAEGGRLVGAATNQDPRGRLRTRKPSCGQAAPRPTQPCGPGPASRATNPAMHEARSSETRDEDEFRVRASAASTAGAGSNHFSATAHLVGGWARRRGRALCRLPALGWRRRGRSFGSHDALASGCTVVKRHLSISMRSRASPCRLRTCKEVTFQRLVTTQEFAFGRLLPSLRQLEPRCRRHDDCRPVHLTAAPTPTHIALPC